MSKKEPTKTATKKVAKKKPNQRNTKTTSTEVASIDPQALAYLAEALLRQRDRDDARASREEEDLVISIKLEIGQGGQEDLIVDLETQTVLSGILDELRLPDAVDLVRDTLLSTTITPAVGKIQSLTNAWMLEGADLEVGGDEFDDDIDHSDLLQLAVSGSEESDED